jgi:chlorobactene glucosyltransferase
MNGHDAAMWGVLCGPAGLALGLTLVNLASWPRGEARAAARRVSVLIPARNEEQHIERCVRAVMTCGAALHEVIVFDDLSTDQTPAILAHLAEEFGGERGLRVVQGSGLPEGWVGKPHACHRLAQEATGDVLLFLDADVRLEVGGIARVLSLMEGKRADVVTMVPRQTFEQGTSWAPGLVVPLLHLTYTSWFPLVLTWLSRDVRFLAANGQVLAVERAAYDAVGGFEAVRDQVVDDMAFCGLVKRSGRRVVFADGFAAARCQMYRTGAQVWEGFSKNIYPGLGASAPGLLCVILLYTSAFVAPYAALAGALSGLMGAGWLLPGAVGVGLNIALRAVLAWRMRHPWWSVAAQPVGVVALLLIALNSARWVWTGRVRWSGRTIPVAGRGAAQAEPSGLRVINRES